MSHEHFFYDAALVTISVIMMLLGWANFFLALGTLHHIGIYKTGAPSIPLRAVAIVSCITCFWASAWVFMYVA